jgi:hypothetical protein
MLLAIGAERDVLEEYLNDQPYADGGARLVPLIQPVCSSRYAAGTVVRACVVLGTRECVANGVVRLWNVAL